MRSLFALLFTALLCTAPSGWAQSLVVHHTDGSTLTIPLSEIDSLKVATVEAEAHAAVDLGLSVCWAATNVGADVPEQAGAYFAWGEVEAKDDYSEEAYAYYVNGQYRSIGTQIGGTAYDAARTLWGDTWRLPTITEVEELMTRCTWTKETLNNVVGYRVTGPNGATLFLPAAGHCAGTAPQGVGSRGFYWTGTLSTDLSSAAYTLNFMGYEGRWSASRAYGMPIRAVCPLRRNRP